jgi:hypothetical protein
VLLSEAKKVRILKGVERSNTRSGKFKPCARSCSLENSKKELKAKEVFGIGINAKQFVLLYLTTNGFL